MSVGAAGRVGVNDTPQASTATVRLFSTVLSNRTSTLTTVKHKYVLAGKGYGAMIYLDFSQFMLE